MSTSDPITPSSAPASQTATTTTAQSQHQNQQPAPQAGLGRAHARRVVSTASIWVMFVIGVFTTCLAPLLVGNVIYVLARIVVPATTLPGTFARYAHICAITYLSFGIVFNFVTACSVHPGVIPAIYVDACSSYLAKNPDAALRFCDRCKVPKAPRSHHCGMCGECVLKMDHHCPWINGCVGYHNYKYFFGFLLWLLVGTIYSFSSCAYMLWFHDKVYHHAFDKVTSETNQVFFIFVLTVAIAMTMCLYVGFGSYGILTNQSAVEFHISKEVTSAGSYYRNPYNLGWFKNAVECLGPETTPWQISGSMALAGCWPTTSAQVAATGSGGVSSGGSPSSSIGLFCSNRVTKYYESAAGKILRLIWLTVPNIQLMPHEGVWFPTANLSSSA